MNLWNFFKRKKKTKSGICFSKEKSKEELVKNFLEINADKIETITTETGEELTGNTSKFFLYLKDFFFGKGIWHLFCILKKYN